MARPRRIDSDLIGKAQEIAAVAKDLHTLRGAQSVLDLRVHADGSRGRSDVILFLAADLQDVLRRAP